MRPQQVMVFDATDGTVGPHAGHVHCMLSWATDPTDKDSWQWVDAGGLAGLKEFIPAGELGTFESHVCFAAHSPMKMADGSTRLCEHSNGRMHQRSFNAVV